MIGRILGNHPFIHTMKHEAHFFEGICRPEDMGRTLSFAEAVDLTARLVSIQRDGYHYQRDFERFFGEAESIIKGVYDYTLMTSTVFEAFLRYEAVRNGRTIPCEKAPGYVYYISEILTLYPGAKIINVVRDPRDVLLSQKNKWKRRFLGRKTPLRESLRVWIHYHPVSKSKLWDAAVKSAYKFLDLKRVYSLRFEDVLENPEGEIKKLCEFIGIHYDRHMLEVPKVGSSLIVDRPEEKGIDKQRIGNWQKGGLNSGEVYLCQVIAGASMSKLGYRPLKLFPNPLLLIFYCITFPVKLCLAFLTNIGKMKNIRDALRRRVVYD